MRLTNRAQECICGKKQVIRQEVLHFAGQYGMLCHEETL